MTNGIDVLKSVIDGVSEAIVGEEVKMVEEFLDTCLFSEMSEYSDVVDLPLFVNYGVYYDINNVDVSNYIIKMSGKKQYERIRKLILSYKNSFPYPNKWVLREEDQDLTEVIGKNCTDPVLASIIGAVKENELKPAEVASSNLCWMQLVKYFPLFTDELVPVLNKFNNSPYRVGGPRFFIGDMFAMPFYNPQTVINFANVENKIKSRFEMKITKLLNQQEAKEFSFVGDVKDVGTVKTIWTNKLLIVNIVVKYNSKNQIDSNLVIKGLNEFMSNSRFRQDMYKDVSLQIPDRRDLPDWNSVVDTIIKNNRHFNFHIFKEGDGRKYSYL